MVMMMMMMVLMVVVKMIDEYEQTATYNNIDDILYHKTMYVMI